MKQESKTSSTPREVILAMAADQSLPVQEFVSWFAQDPYGPSRARMTFLEMKEEGLLELTVDGIMIKCNRVVKKL